jgi:hypothetical protein
LEVRVKLLPLFTIASVVAVALALPAFGGKPNGPTLDVTMNTTSGPTATSVSSFTLYGCGYNKLTTLELWHNGVAPAYQVTPDANGCVWATFPNAGSGDYTGWGMEQQGKAWNLVVQKSFSV